MFSFVNGEGRRLQGVLDFFFLCIYTERLKHFNPVVNSVGWKYGLIDGINNFFFNEILMSLEIYLERLKVKTAYVIYVYFFYLFIEMSTIKSECGKC